MRPSDYLYFIKGLGLDFIAFKVFYYPSLISSNVGRRTKIKDIFIILTDTYLGFENRFFFKSGFNHLSKNGEPEILFYLLGIHESLRRLIYENYSKQPINLVLYEKSFS